MKRKLLPLIFIYTLCTVPLLQGQDIQYSQYYANPLYLNPAFAGAIPAHRMVVNHRLQWPNLPRAFANYSVSYDYFMAGLNSGFGIIANVDQAGSAALRSTSVAFNYSYNIAVEDKFVLKPGLAIGVVDRTIDYEKLLFGDQIDFGLDGAPSQDPTVTEIEGNSYIDVATGFLAYSKNYWVGFSIFHINEPNTSIVQGSSTLPAKITFHAGARFEVGNKAFKDIKKGNIAPGFIYKRQGKHEQFDIGGSFHYSPVIFGLWYRGLPFKKNMAGLANQDAIVFVFGMEFQNFEFGYSFDANISRLGPETGGAHEFSLQYLFDIRRDPRKVSRHKKILHCPAFTRKSF